MRITLIIDRARSLSHAEKDVCAIAACGNKAGYAATALVNSLGEWPNVRLNAALNALSDS